MDNDKSNRSGETRFFPDQNTNETRRRGRALSAAREYGLEMIDEDRMKALLIDLMNENMIGLGVSDMDIVAKRAMEILRG